MGVVEKRYHVSPIRKAGDLRFRNKRDYAHQQITMKPKGAWWSVGASWMNWCEGESWNVGGRVFEVDVDVFNVLRIRSDDELHAFHAEFSASPKWYDFDASEWNIDWRQVAERYTGVEIAPYLWRCRLNGPARWYYGWDCASGVTWKPRTIIQAVREVGQWSDEIKIADLLGLEEEE